MSLSECPRTRKVAEPPRLWVVVRRFRVNPARLDLVGHRAQIDQLLRMRGSTTAPVCGRSVCALLEVICGYSFTFAGSTDTMSGSEA